MEGFKLKILFISENYYPKLSGVPVVVQYLAERLNEKGHDVAVLTKKIEGCSDFEIFNGIKIIRFDIYMNKLKMYKGKINEFIEYIKQYNADVYIFEGATVVTTDVVLPYLKDINGIKILHSHGFSRLLLKPFQKMSTFKNTIGNTYNYIRWKGFFKSLLPKYINDFNIVFCLSEVDSSYKYLNQIFNGKVNVIGNAADDIFFEKSKRTIEKYTTIKGKGYLLSVANYDAIKNQIGILQQYYKSQSKDYDLVFIGREKNYYYEALIDENKKLSKQYGEKNVHILTDIKREDIPGIYEYAFLYLVGSVAEGYSISIIESMSKGVPFISTDVGNARLLPGGIVIKNINQLCTTIDKIINSTKLYKKMSVNGKQYAFENCRIESATSMLLKLIYESEN